MAGDESNSDPRLLEEKSGAQLDDTVFFQAYEGGARRSGATDAAVDSTRGLALHDLFRPPATPDVVVMRTRRTANRPPSPSSDSLTQIDMTVIDGIPVTTTARTLIDVAGLLPRPIFEDLFDTAIVRRLTCYRFPQRKSSA